MRLSGELTEGTLIERPTRFSCLVVVEEREEECYFPNPGRLKELLTPGARVILRKIESQRRKTRFDIIGLNHGDTLVSVDSRVPNKLFQEAFEEKAMKEFAAYESIKPEYRYGGSRVDFLLQGLGEKCLLEVKSCTLVKGGVALFPDAVTERGTRHVYELVEALKEGYRAVVLFIVQRPDAEVFSPNDETDERFSEALREAWRRGVGVYAYSAEFVGREINLKERLQVKL